MTAPAAGCGGDSESTTVPSTQAATEAPEPTTTVPASPDPTSAEMEPGSLGDRIGDVYVTAIEDVVAATADRPDGPAAMAALQELKERYIQTLVELGHQREALDTAGRSAVDARIGLALAGVPSDVFGAYQQAQADYRDVAPEVAELIASFNIITQYANFDLLRSQSPEEAARVLGD